MNFTMGLKPNTGVYCMLINTCVLRICKCIKLQVKIEDKRNGYPNWNMEDMSHLPWIDDVVADDIKRTRNSIVIANGGGGGGGGNKMDDVDDEPGEKESLL